MEASIKEGLSRQLQFIEAGDDHIADADTRALSGLRVLDLSGSSEQYCGKLFAQMGADVLLIEPPGGSGMRRAGPFLEHRPHFENSLGFAYLNQGKRGICVDLDTPNGQAIVHELARKADLLIETQRPSVAARRGLDYASLARSNPGIVVTSITPFGRTGPYAEYLSEDLIAMALGGLLYLGGYPETEPVGAPGEQAYLAAAQFGAVASLTALWEAGTEGEALGQHVDVSVQACVVAALENTVQFVDLENTVRTRSGGHQRQAGTGVFPCSDGLIYLMAGGVASNRFWSATTRWLIDAGAPGAAQLNDPCWLDPAYLATDPAKQIFAAVFLPFAARFSKAELYEEGQRRRIPVCPISTTADLLGNRQLIHRHYFVETEHRYSGARLTVPGAPYRLTQTPWQVGNPAPRLGEHTAEVLTELGYDSQAQAVLLRERVTG